MSNEINFAIPSSCFCTNEAMEQCMALDKSMGICKQYLVNLINSENEKRLFIKCQECYDNSFVKEAGKFTHITKFITEVQQELNESNRDHMNCLFNWIPLTIYRDSRMQDICQIYNLKLEMKRMKGED